MNTVKGNKVTHPKCGHPYFCDNLIAAQRFQLCKGVSEPSCSWVTMDRLVKSSIRARVKRARAKPELEPLWLSSIRLTSLNEPQLT